MAPRYHFTIVSRTKICGTALGEVVQCEVQRQADGTATTSTVVVKSINLTLAKELKGASLDRAIDDLVQEQRVANALIASGGHPNVVQPVCHFVHDDTVFLVSEFCRSGDLHTYLMTSCANHSVSEHESLHMMQQILRGVHFLHALGIAHRDLSLENILLHDGVCKVSDFGLSTDVHRACSECVGKEYYMAPEIVARTQTYDPMKADVWSLGVIWFVLLTGSPLVPVASPSERAFKVFALHGVSGIFQAWGLTSSISHETTELLSQMLQIDPSARISVDDVLAHALMQTAH